MRPSIKAALFFLRVGPWVWEMRSGWHGYAMHAGQVGDCRRPLPGGPRPQWEGPCGVERGGRRDRNKASPPRSCVWGQARSGPGQVPVRVKAEEPPLVGKFQGQLGIHLRQKQLWNQASDSSVWRSLEGAAGGRTPPWDIGGACSHCVGQAGSPMTPSCPAALLEKD